MHVTKTLWVFCTSIVINAYQPVPRYPYRNGPTFGFPRPGVIRHMETPRIPLQQPWMMFPPMSYPRSPYQQPWYPPVPPPPYGQAPYPQQRFPPLPQPMYQRAYQNHKQRPRFLRAVVQTPLIPARNVRMTQGPPQQPVNQPRPPPPPIRGRALKSVSTRAISHPVPQTAAFNQDLRPSIQIMVDEVPDPNESPRSADFPMLNEVEPLELLNSMRGRQGRRPRFEDAFKGCSDGQVCRTLQVCDTVGGMPTGQVCGRGPGYFCCDLSSNDIETNSTVNPYSDPYCGRSREGTSRIVGGYGAEFGEYPWQAFLRIGNKRCGGAVLNSKYVITAAHCVYGKPIDEIGVYLGELVLNRSIEELPHEVRRVNATIIHPDYVDLKIDSHDVALIRLDRPVEYQANILPICLPERGEDITGRVGVVSGWGRLFGDENEYKPEQLQAVKVPVIENAQCRHWLRLRGKWAKISKDHVCAGYPEGGRDACMGDSGGPLATKLNGRWTLIGLVSAGFGCSEPLQPGIYHRVSHTIDWIAKQISK